MAKLQIFFPDGTEATHDLPEEKTSIGRVPENQLHIPDDSVSSHHAEIIFENANFYVRDLNSTNGTYVNGSKTDSAALKHGDEVRFGSVACLFLIGNADAVAAAESNVMEEQTTAIQSKRPEEFVSSSPAPRTGNGKESSPILVALAALLGIGATAAAVYLIFQPPA